MGVAAGTARTGPEEAEEHRDLEAEGRHTALRNAFLACIAEEEEEEGQDYRLEAGRRVQRRRAGLGRSRV